MDFTHTELFLMLGCFLCPAVLHFGSKLEECWHNWRQNRAIAARRARASRLAIIAEAKAREQLAKYPGAFQRAKALCAEQEADSGIPHSLRLAEAYYLMASNYLRIGDVSFALKALSDGNSELDLLDKHIARRSGRKKWAGTN